MREDVITMTVVMSKEDKKALKRLALDMDTTASALVVQWLHEHLEAGKCGDGAGAAGT